MLLETLSESDIQLLDSRVRDDKHQQDDNITNDCIANASNIPYSTCSRNVTDRTSSTSSFATATETDLN